MWNPIVLLYYVKLEKFGHFSEKFLASQLPDQSDLSVEQS